MYGNVDAAFCFFKKYSGILVDELGFTQSLSDPCIFYKHKENGHLAIVISTHVDDSLFGGWKHKLEEFYIQFMHHLKIERLGQLKKHLGVWWTWLMDKDSTRDKTGICSHDRQKCQGGKDSSIPQNMSQASDRGRRSSKDNQVPFYCW